MTTASSKNGATTLSRMNFSGCVRHATTFVHFVEYLLLRAV